MNIGKIDSKGQTLIIVMLIAIVLLIMMLSLTSKVILNTSQNSLTYSGQIAFSAAQSGIQNGLSYIGKNEFASTTNPIPQPLPVSTAPINCSTGSIRTTPPKPTCTYNITPQNEALGTVNQGQSMAVNLQGSITAVHHSTTTTAYNGTLNAWKSTQPLPQNISNAGNTSYGSNEYIVGGLSGGTALNSVYETTMSQTGTTNWSNVSTLPTAVYNNSTVTNGSYIYSIGGVSQVRAVYYRYVCGWHYYSVYYYYNGQYYYYSYWYYTCQWEPYTYYYTSPTTNVYVSPLSNIGSWSQTSSLPQNMYHTSAVEYQNNIFLFGGRNYYGGALNTIYEANIEPGGGLSSWTQVGTMPQSLYGSGITVSISNGYAYLVGGNNGGGGSNSIYVYNLVTQSNCSSTNNTSITSLDVVSSGSGLSAGATKYVINGCNLGYLSPRIGDTPYFALSDQTRGWQAGWGGGWNSNVVTVNYQSWNNNQIVINQPYNNYGGNGGQWVWNQGDNMQIMVSNPQTGQYSYIGFSFPNTNTTYQGSVLPSQIQLVQQSTFPGGIYNEGIGILPDPANSGINYIYSFGGILNGQVSNSTYYATLNNMSSWQSTSTMIVPTSAMGYSIYTGAGASNLFSFGGYQNLVEYTSINAQVVNTSTTSTSSPFPDLLININSLITPSPPSTTTANYELQILTGTSTNQTMEVCLIQSQPTGSNAYIAIPANSTIAYITPLNSKMKITAYPTTLIPSGSNQIQSSDCNTIN
ncbi:MAG: Kelch repeat-containing protein [Patescibacteria group bacterium]